jgi:hypothetical protein
MKKQTSEQKILNALKEKGPMTQAELLRVTKVKGVYTFVSKMVREGKLAKNGKQVMLMAVDETTKIDGKKVSEAIYKPTKMKNISEHFQDERDRLVKEIEIRLNEYAYVMNQLMKLDDEA